MSLLVLFEFALKFNLAVPTTADLNLNLVSSDFRGKLLLIDNFIAIQS
jgi:hypothetical protein